VLIAAVPVFATQFYLMPLAATETGRGPRRSVPARALRRHDGILEYWQALGAPGRGGGWPRNV
jgi:hypothetical protein